MGKERKKGAAKARKARSRGRMLWGGALAGIAGVALVVTDDGVGILESRSDGLGLANIEARAEELGGRFSVSPGPDGGTRFTWRVPARPSLDRGA